MHTQNEDNEVLKSLEARIRRIVMAQARLALHRMRGIYMLVSGVAIALGGSRGVPIGIWLVHASGYAPEERATGEVEARGFSNGLWAVGHKICGVVRIPGELSRRVAIVGMERETTEAATRPVEWRKGAASWRRKGCNGGVEIRQQPKSC
jgi:hypothetical protein